MMIQLPHTPLDQSPTGSSQWPVASDYLRLARSGQRPVAGELRRSKLATGYWQLATGHWPLATPHLPSSGADLEHVREPLDVEEARVLDTDTKAPEVREESQELER